MFPTFSQVRPAIEDDVQKVNSERLKVQAYTKKWIRILLAIAGANVGLVILSSLLAATGISQFLILIVLLISMGWFITLIVMLVKIAGKNKQLRIMFKQQIVSRIAQEMIAKCELPNATKDYRYESNYQPNQHVSPHMIGNSKLFNYRIDKYRGDDLFTGQIGLTAFEFSELELIQIQTSTDSNGNTTRRDVALFKGILFIADFNKKFNGITTLHAENFISNSFLGKLVQPLTRSARGDFDGKKKLSIDLESEEFNNTFDITTTDEIEARYILTSSMIERILEFRRRHPQKIELSFVDSLMCISLADNKNYFEIKKFGKDFESELESMYNDLMFFFGMVETFDLNTRIWTKQ
jgi:hypothetical protein